MINRDRIIDMLLTDSLAFLVNNTIGKLLGDCALCRYSWE